MQIGTRMYNRYCKTGGKYSNVERNGVGGGGWWEGKMGKVKMKKVEGRDFSILKRQGPLYLVDQREDHRGSRELFCWIWKWMQLKVRKFWPKAFTILKKIKVRFPTSSLILNSILLVAHSHKSFRPFFLYFFKCIVSNKINKCGYIRHNFINMLFQLWNVKQREEWKMILVGTRDTGNRKISYFHLLPIFVCMQEYNVHSFVFSIFLMG